MWFYKHELIFGIGLYYELLFFGYTLAFTPAIKAVSGSLHLIYSRTTNMIKMRGLIFLAIMILKLYLYINNFIDRGDGPEGEA